MGSFLEIMGNADTLSAVAAGSVGALIGLIGVVWVAKSNSAAQTELNIWNTTLDLQKEFNSRAMQDDRRTAMDAILRYPKIKLEVGEEKKFKSLSRDDLDAIWSVADFYYRLSLLARKNRVKKDYIPRAFGQTFVWYMTAYFDDYEDGPAEEIAKELRWLKSQIIGEYSNTEERAALDRWASAAIVKAAETDR
ncbi:hypothetical protein [Paraurantiacibacter namhicola]|uniref:DUF4760 domain-containing protein n=1 Tax=Paraurantiacibacter namhicola TaxID=645517 RepID=A0A1C7D545_9SPHN|nr:hypothetical protein [Paraurantiacibacter namhicola]ANU06569.1 hypothetical protein A6F65_00242 [Paraurantiacibacter namhicola]